MLFSLSGLSNTLKDNLSFGKPIIDYYPAHVYKAHEHNWSMIIADDGNLYTGNGNGVVEYDGVTWRLIKTPNLGAVRSLKKDKNGIIYAGSVNSFGYLKADIYGQLHYHELSNTSDVPDKNFDEVYNVFVFEDSVYFVASHWLFRLNTNSLGKQNSIKAWQYIEDSPIKDVFVYDSQLYFSSVNFNLKIDKYDNLVKISFFSDANNQRINVIETIQTPQSEMVFSKNNVYLKEDKFSKWNTVGGEFLTDSWIYDVMPYNKDYFVVATVTKGVVFVSYDGKNVFNISKEHGLPNEISIGITTDNQDGLWVGSLNRGMSRIQSPLSLRIDKKNLGLQKINTIIRYKNHLLGLSFSDIAIFSQGEFQHYDFAFNQLQSMIDSEINGLLVVGYFGIVLVNIDFSQLPYVFSHEIIQNKITVEEIIKSHWHNNEFLLRLKNGIARLQFSDNKWSYQLLEEFQHDVVSFALNQQDLWLSLSTGDILKIEEFNQLNEYSYKTYTIPNHTPQFKTRLFPSSEGLIATYDNQLFNFNSTTNKFSQFKKLDISSEIELLQQDKQGRFWLSTKSSMQTFADKSFENPNRALSNYLSPDLTLNMFFDEQNINYLIQNSGIVSINSDIELMPAITPRIKSIQLGKKLLPMDTTTVLHQHDIQFNISYPDFAKTKSAQFKTCLSGENCTNWSSNTSINYSNISGGSHELTLYSGNSDRAINQFNFKFEVAKYWYQTLWFKLLAVLLTAFIIYIISKISTHQIKKRNKHLQGLVKKRTTTIEKQAEELHQLDEARIRFFANVSHEFRTPLTLAIAPLESMLLDNPNLEKRLSRPVQTSIANSKKMLSLVGQILDFNRLESGRFPLRIAQYDVADLLNQLAIRFRLWAQKNQQIINTKNTQEPKLLYCDQEQIDKCLSNLISNAIKYSGNKSEITLEIIKQGQQIGLRVSDTGKGVSQESQDKVFDRFYQDQQSEAISDAGTGIGLSLVKELIELHHGTVEFENNIGTGCKFSLWLKQGKSHFDAEQLYEPINSDVKTPSIPIELPKPLIKENSTSQDDITTILVVDDNIELCDFIASRLSSYYHVIQKHNGKEGLSAALIGLPDLIISDVMMPVMNGLEMAKQLKNNKSTNTIPIILLTAKSSKREVVEGLQTGADDYLSKPFDTSELIMRVAGLINNRKLIRQTIKLSFSQEATQMSKNDEFTIHFNAFVTQQLSNPNLSVDDIANELNLSPSSLFRKCNTKFKKTPTKIIRDIRMLHAQNLLIDDKLTISEIAYGTGFDSLSYFSRTFKKYFGKSPSSLRH